MISHLQLYRQQQAQHEVEQASSVKIIVLLYNKVISLLQQALVRLDEGDLAKKGEALLKAADILAELKAILNTEEGGDIAEKLDGLYAYAIQQITLANFNNDPGPITDVLKTVEELRKGWQELDRMVQAEEVAPSLSKRP